MTWQVYCKQDDSNKLKYVEYSSKVEPIAEGYKSVGSSPTIQLRCECSLIGKASVCGTAEYWFEPNRSPHLFN